jgi:hypothetical protein
VTRVPTVRKADLVRVLKALADRGLAAGSVLVRPGGDVVITPTIAGALTVGPIIPPDAEAQNLDEWREKKRGRREAPRAQ